MILTCPDCSTKFRVNPQAIPPAGRMVKCAKCGHKWHAQPEGADEEDAFPDLDFDRSPPPAPPSPPLAEEEDTPPPPRMPVFEEGPPPISPADFMPQQKAQERRKPGPLVAWVILLLILLGGAGSLYVFREQVVLAFPPSQKIYHALGIDAAIPGYGLEIASTPADISVVQGEDGHDDLVVRGYLINPTDHRITVPHIKGDLRNAAGAVIHSWTFRPDVHEILPGERAAFTTHIDNPPLGGTRVEFITQTEAEVMGGMASNGSH